MRWKSDMSAFQTLHKILSTIWADENIFLGFLNFVWVPHAPKLHTLCVPRTLRWVPPHSEVSSGHYTVWRKLEPRTLKRKISLQNIFGEPIIFLLRSLRGTCAKAKYSLIINSENNSLIYIILQSPFSLSCQTFCSYCGERGREREVEEGQGKEEGGEEETEERRGVCWRLS